MQDIRGEKNPNWKGGKIKTICLECGKKIKKSKARMKIYNLHFCGNICRLKNWKNSFLSRWTYINCVICGKKVKSMKSRLRKVCSNECKCKLFSINKLSEKNVNWKGNNVGKQAIHIWVKKRLLKPKKCEFCNKNIPHDLANISQKYKRDLKDWNWLCRKCHMLSDGRLKNFIEYRFKSQK